MKSVIAAAALILAALGGAAPALADDGTDSTDSNTAASAGTSDPSTATNTKATAPEPKVTAPEPTVSTPVIKTSEPKVTTTPKATTTTTPKVTTTSRPRHTTGPEPKVVVIKQAPVVKTAAPRSAPTVQAPAVQAPKAVVSAPAPALAPVAVSAPAPAPAVAVTPEAVEPQTATVMFAALKTVAPPSSPVTPPATPAAAAMLTMVGSAKRQSSFGRIFDNLPALNQQTNQQLADLAQTMQEDPTGTDNPSGEGGGITFFGQFIDHDLTLDTLPQPSSTVDPTTLKNSRTFAFDLDSVYGGGPKVSPQLYDGNKFKIGVATDGVSPDLPRNPDGSAILVEARNDENVIIAQIHLSFLRLHNELIDQGMSFAKAQETVINAYRYVVLNDYLPQIVGQDAVNAALATPLRKGFYDPGSKKAPMTPVEFSVAAFRFGHSQVRNTYAINEDSGQVPVFSFDPTVQTLTGGRQLPGDLVISFDNFFTELAQSEGDVNTDDFNISRAIDTKISPSLFQLPIPGSEATGSNVLAFRNMLRAGFYDMPSFEDVSATMGVLPLRDPVTGELVAPVFPEGTPLWYGILREAELTTGGARLGAVGGKIVAETFVDVMRLSTGADGKYINLKAPKLPDETGGIFQVGDLVTAADNLAAQPAPPPPTCHNRNCHHAEHDHHWQYLVGGQKVT